MTARIIIPWAVGLLIGMMAPAQCGRAEPSEATAQGAAKAESVPANPEPPPHPAGEDAGQPSSDRDLLLSILREMRSAEQLIRQRIVTSETQRRQQEALAGLTRLIDQYAQAERTSPQQSAPQTTQAAAKKPTSGEPGDSGAASAPTSQSPPGTSSGAVKDLVSEVWGQLPAELQQQIQSPVHEQFLPEYEQLIVEYYKRLAEDQRR
jgi:hypothetical protein